jgi:ribosomal protein S12 methylthiotransferase
MNERLSELRELQDAITSSKRDELLDQKVTVLVDEPGIARSFREAPEIDGVVQVPESLQVGQFYEVTIEQVFGPDVIAAHDPVSQVDGAHRGR